MDIQPVTPTAPIQKTIKIRRDEEQAKQQNNAPPNKQKEPTDDENDSPHIDEIV